MITIEQLENIFEKKDNSENPLVCFLTNHVTELDLVDACINAGGSPVLTDEISESHEMLEYAGVNALMINLGTINREYLDIMINTGRLANKLNIPIILDPAAISASSFRKEAILRLLDELKITVLKANLGEIKTILGYTAKSKGIDSFEDERDAVSYCIELANKKNFIVAMTGKDDIITDGKKIVRISNGTPRLKKICGAGSTVGSLIATFSGYTDDYFLSSVLGTLVVGISGEIAEKRLAPQDGNRTFKQYLHDVLSNFSVNELRDYANFYEE